MIYLVEDDASIRELVIYALNNSGFEAQGFDAPSAFWRAMAQQVPSMILLDIMLPEEDGLQILKKLRQNPATRRTPVIMLTAKGSEYDKVIGLEAGADDYVVKPFDRKILLARVKAVLRRGLPVTEGRDFDGLRIDEPSRTATLRGKALDLTAGEFSLLVRLVAHRGRVFARPPDERTVDVQVANLRRKLGRWGDHIETVRGVGYRISEFGQ